jgi:hypothetical protein
MLFDYEAVVLSLPVKFLVIKISVVGHDPGHQFFVLVFRLFWGVNDSFPLTYRYR